MSITRYRFTRAAVLVAVLSGATGAVIVHTGATGAAVTCSAVPSDGVKLTRALVDRCDYRLTGARCEEDQVCAVGQILDTGDFRRVPQTG